MCPESSNRSRGPDPTIPPRDSSRADPRPIEGSGPPLGEPARSQRIAVFEGALATVHITITNGPLLTAYALLLGASDFALGLMAAMAALSAAGAFFGAQAVGVLRRRKGLTVASALSGRSLWILLCLLPFVDLGRDARLTLFLGVVLVGNGLAHMAGTAWLSWMTDLVPLRERGRYFGWRNTVVGAVGLLASYGAGASFDLFISRGREPEGLAVIFAAAVVFAWAAAATLGRQWEPPLRGERRRPLLFRLRLPFSTPRFRRLLVFLLLWAGATGISSAFFGAHMIRNLEMSFSRIALYSVIAGLVGLIFHPLWGRVIDRFGNRPVLLLNYSGVVVLPLLWLFATPNQLVPIWADAVLTGVYWPGFNLAIFNLLLATAPKRNRTSYLGVHTLAVGLTTFVASLLGGVLAEALSGVRMAVAGLSLTNFQILFALSSLLRLALLPLALRLREEGARPLGPLVGVIGDKVTQRFHHGLHIGIGLLRRHPRR